MTMSKQRFRKHYGAYNQHLKEETLNTTEEYAFELTPTIDLPINLEEVKSSIKEKTTQNIQSSLFNLPTFSSSQFIGYFALFLSLLSIAFYPFLLGSAGIILSVITIQYGERTLGYTAFIFSLFSLIFALLYSVNVF